MIKQQLAGTARHVAGENRGEAVKLFGSKAKQSRRLSRPVRNTDHEDFADPKDAIEDCIWPEHTLWLAARP